MAIARGTDCTCRPHAANQVGCCQPERDIHGNRVGRQDRPPLAVAAITIAYGYRVSWIAAAAALLVIGLPFAYWCYHKPRVPHGQLSKETSSSPVVRSWTRREVLQDPIFWILLMGILAPPFIGTTIFYHQNYMTMLNDWPPQLFATSLLVLALTLPVASSISMRPLDE